MAGQLNNTGTGALNFPQASLMSFFRRCRVLVAGTEIENVEHSGRVAEMLSRLRPANRSWSDSTQGLGGPEQLTAGTSSGFLDGWHNDPLAGGASRKFLSLIGPSGFLQTHYWLNGRHPLQIELEFADPSLCVVGGDVNRSYTMTNVRLLCDIVHVSSEILEKYNQLLETTNGIPLHFSSYATTMRSMPGVDGVNSNFDLMVQRSFSRLKTVFVTFSNAHYRTSREADGAATPDAKYTEHSHFLSWAGGGSRIVGYGAPQAYTIANDNCRVQLAIGPLLFPQYPADSHAELYYMLSKAMALDSSVDGMSFPPQEYRRTSHIEAFDLEKSNGAPGSGLMAYTGVSTKDTGDAIRLSYQGITATANHVPDRIYVTMHYDAFAVLMREGCLLQN